MDRPDSTTPLRTLERMYLAHGALVRATLRARGVPASALDDVVHDVFITAHRRLRALDSSTSTKHWLIGLARNAAFSHLRSAARRRRRHAQLVPTPVVEDPMSVEVLDARRSWEVLTGFLASLPAKQREAFMLCTVAGLPASELASEWGCSPHTVHSRVRLARQRFVERFPSADGVGDHEALLAAARREVEPSPERRRRAWAVLAADLARPWWLAVGSTKVAVVAVVAAVTTVGVVGYEAPEVATPETRGSIAQVETPTPALATAAPPAARHPEPEPLRPHASAPAAAPGRPVAVRQPREREKPEPPPPADDLRPELEMLTRARGRLRAGDAEGALHAVHDHAHRFPEGTLSTERRRLEVDVLCRLGRDEDAAAVVRAIDEALPQRTAGRTANDPCRK